MSRRRLSKMDKFVQKEVKDLRPVYNGKIPIQEIVKSLTKKKEKEVRDFKDIDLSDVYGIIQDLIKDKLLIIDDRDRLMDIEENKLNVYIDQLSSKREDGMVIIRPAEQSKYPK